MSRLILDFVARRWWVMLLILAISIAVVASGQALPFTPIALIVLIFDAQRGLIRTVRPLPIPRRTQAAAWWFIGVPLGSVVSAIGHFVGVLLYQSRHHGPGAFDPWFVAPVITWLGLGYAALCFLLCIALPTRAASNSLETIWQGLIGALWGLSMSGPTLFMFIVPKNAAGVLPWHWLIFALVPVLLVISFLAAPDMADRRMRALTAGAKPATVPAENDRSGLTGSAFFLTNTIGRALLILTLVGASQLAIGLYIGHGRTSAENPSFGLQMVAFAIIFGSMPGETTGMRVLRALPLSTAQLTRLLLAVPITLGFVCAAYIAAAHGLIKPSPSGPLAFLAVAMATAGAGCLALAISLHIVSAARILVLMLFAFIPAFCFYLVSAFAPWVILGGASAIGLAFVMLERGLRKSNAFYQPRRFFGINVGQPLSGH